MRTRGCVRTEAAGGRLAFGIAAGATGGYLFAGVAASLFEHAVLPGTLPMLLTATVLAVAAVIASLMPAVRAARVDVLQALRSE